MNRLRQGRVVAISTLTWTSLPGRPLPGRISRGGIVESSDSLIPKRP